MLEEQCGKCIPENSGWGEAMVVSVSFRRLLVLMLLGIICLLLSACSSTAGDSASQPPGALPVDPIFREFYNTLGGRPVLGYAISPAIQQDGICQYTSAALMCYDTGAADSARFSLRPIGAGLVDREQPDLLLDPNARQVDGYTIYEKFVKLYDRLQGARYAGHPLTQVRINYQQNRVEQYFENVGFYIPLDDKEERVRLISYGAASCGSVCTYQPELESTIIGGQPEVVPGQLYTQQIIRLGGVRVFGQPLTRPYQNADGTWEQVYERVVFYSTTEDPGTMRVRPVPIILGTAFSLPGPRINDSRMVFYPTQGDQGYNVPKDFDRFIARHGSVEISGRPISAVFQVGNQQLYRQCFENYCLDYDPSAAPELRVQITPLGAAYISHKGIGDQAVTPFQLTPDTVIVSVGEILPQIASNAEQTIVMMVVERKDQRPIPNIEGDLTVYFPDGSTYQAHLPPTAANGISSVTVPPQPQLDNGTLLTYQVCVTAGTAAPVCVPESYLIWNNQ